MLRKLSFSLLFFLSCFLNAGVGPNGMSYYDMGKFNIWPYMRYDEAPYGTIDVSKMEMFFKSVSEDMKAACMDTLTLSFSQICDISNYYENNFQWDGDKEINFSRQDIIGLEIWQIDAAQQKAQLDPSIDLLTLFLEGFHKNGIRINLSFGGANASLPEFVLGTGDIAENQRRLIAFMDRYQIDGLDLDIEFALTPAILDPLKTLLRGLKQAGKKVSLTVMMSLADWPNGYLKSLFFDEAGNRIFEELFDGLNFMAYDETNYYLEANSPSWGVKPWIDIIGKEAVSKVRFGFYDHVPYEGTADRALRGEKAAVAYMQLIQDLQAEGYPTNFADPFWWPSEDQDHHHYDPPNEDGSVDFISDDQVTFYKTLNSGFSPQA